MLLRDAVYVKIMCIKYLILSLNSLGYSAYNLYDRVSFKEWFFGMLKPEMENQDPNRKLLRMRCAWLCGKWVEQVKPDYCKPVYGSVISLMFAKDLVLQLTAIDSCKQCMLV